MAAALVIGLAAAAVGAFVLVRWAFDVGRLRPSTGHLATARVTPNAPASAAVSRGAVPIATPAFASPPANDVSAPNYFTTLPAGTRLPSSAQCAAWVRLTAFPEKKAVNIEYNQITGHGLGRAFFPTDDDPRANKLVGSRVDGNFTGTSQQILRWAACKWGIDEDVVYAQAAKESWWRQTTLGDWGSDPTQCAPGHGLGADGRPGECPQSFGILQNRYATARSSWPGIGTSTAMSADAAYATWRACFEGYEHWLNDVDRGGPYGAGDAWGCVGRWYAGRWHTALADEYIAGVQDYIRQRIWEHGDFPEL